MTIKSRSALATLGRTADPMATTATMLRLAGAEFTNLQVQSRDLAVGQRRASAGAWPDGLRELRLIVRTLLRQASRWHPRTVRSQKRHLPRSGRAQGRHRKLRISWRHLGHEAVARRLAVHASCEARRRRPLSPSASSKFLGQ